MSKEWQLVKETEANWIKDRPVIEKANSLFNVSLALRGEVSEALEAVAYYLLNPTREHRKEVLQELSDIGIYLMALFRMLDSDMMDEMMEKMAYNATRYMARDFQAGNYQEIYSGRKKELKKECWKETFYSPIPEPQTDQAQSSHPEPKS